MIKDNLHGVLRHALGLQHGFKILDEHKIVEDLGADSLNIVEIVMEVETEFDIEIDDTEIDNIETVNDLVKLIQDLS